MWLTHEGCKRVIESNWGSDPYVTMGDAAVKLKSCGDDLLAWNKTEFGHVQTSIRKKECELGHLLEQVGRGTIPEDIDACRSDL